MLESERDDTGILARLFEHNAWANVKLLDFCEGLSDEQLDSTGIGCYGSIRDTLSHIVRAEVSYVERVNGKLPAVPPRRGEFAGFGVLKDAARWTGEELPALALSAGKETLVEEREGEQGVEYKLSSLMVQAITHSTEHRTQIAAIITQLGMEPPDMSVWYFMEEIEEFREFRQEAGGPKEYKSRSPMDA